MTEGQHGRNVRVGGADELDARYSALDGLARYALLGAVGTILLRVPRLHYFDPIRWVMARGAPKTPPGKARAIAQHENVATRDEHRESDALDIQDAYRRFRGAFLITLMEPSAGWDSRMDSSEMERPVLAFGDVSNDAVPFCPE